MNYLPVRTWEPALCFTCVLTGKTVPPAQQSSLGPQTPALPGMAWPASTQHFNVILTQTNHAKHWKLGLFASLLGYLGNYLTPSINISELLATIIVCLIALKSFYRPGDSASSPARVNSWGAAAFKIRRKKRQSIKTTFLFGKYLNYFFLVILCCFNQRFEGLAVHWNLYFGKKTFL